MTFETAKQAQEQCDKVLTILDPDCKGTWVGRVWYNLGWHVSWQWGSVTMYYDVCDKQYDCLIGAPDGCGGHMDLSQNGAGMSDDPKEAIRLACDHAIEVFEKEWKPIQLSVASVRLSL